MSDDEIRARLAVALDDTGMGRWLNQDAARSGDRTWGHAFARTLLPVVRRLMADELRAAADDWRGYNTGPAPKHLPTYLRNRADKLDPR